MVFRHKNRYGTSLSFLEDPLLLRLRVTLPRKIRQGWRGRFYVWVRVSVLSLEIRHKKFLINLRLPFIRVSSYNKERVLLHTLWGIPCTTRPGKVHYYQRCTIWNTLFLSSDGYKRVTSLTRVPQAYVTTTAPEYRQRRTDPSYWAHVQHWGTVTEDGPSSGDSWRSREPATPVPPRWTCPRWMTVKDRERRTVNSLFPKFGT